MAASYRLQIVPAGARQLKQLSGHTQRKIRQAIRALASDPRPHAARLLSGQRGIWRLRVGDYRVLYRIDDDRLLVLVVRVAHRREVYR